MAKNPKERPEYGLAVTVIQMLEKYGIDIAPDDIVLKKIARCLINTFGDDVAFILYVRIHTLKYPSAGMPGAASMFDESQKGKSKATFASFMFHAERAGVKRMEHLITYRDEHLLICS